MYQCSAWEETKGGLVLVEEEGAMDFPFSDLDLLGIFQDEMLDLGQKLKNKKVRA